MRIKIIAALALLGGCVPTSFYTQPAPLDVQADQFNMAAARAERLMIVRNVMRGRDRTSMIFTRIQSFTGSMQRTVSANAGLTLNEGGDGGSLEPGLTLGGQVSPSFNLAIMNDQKFQRAMGSAIDLGLYRNLIDEGWRANLLHTLFIEKVVQGGRIIENNDPSDSERFRSFQNWLIDAPRHRTLQVCAVSHPDRFSPPLQGAPDLQGVAAVAAQHLEFAPIRRETTAGARPVPRVGPAAAPAREWRVVRPNTDRWLSFDCSQAERTHTQGPGITNDDDEDDSPPTPSGSNRDGIYVRSIEGVLFYLGEIVRAEGSDDNDPLLVNINNDDGSYSQQAIFVVRQSGHPGTGDLVFRHDDGRTYYVSRPRPSGAHSERTHQVITLMLQLIGLLQEREDLPPTASVRVIP